MRKKIAVHTLVILLVLVAAGGVYAKRLLPQAKPVASGKVATASKGINASAKFRGDRRAIVATFSSLAVASSVNYTLSYNSRGTTQGAGGSLSVSGEDPATRELLFGTCSHGVCRYDSGITNAKLVVTTVLKSGKKVIKTFKLKV